MRITLLKTFILITSFCSLFLLNACDSSAIPAEPNGCIWVDDSISVIFNHAEFFIPDKDCKISIEKPTDFLYGPIQGVYNLMHEFETDYSDCLLTWLSSIYTKKCDNYELDYNNRRLLLDLTNYTSKLYPMDIIETAPLVCADCDMLPEDYKHQLIIQLQNTYNTNDGSYGVLTWTNTWLGETDSYYLANNRLWYFDCPANGMYATYTPYVGYLRNIYVYNTFIYMY